MHLAIFEYLDRVVWWGATAQNSSLALVSYQVINRGYFFAVYVRVQCDILDIRVIIDMNDIVNIRDIVRTWIIALLLLFDSRLLL
jgi:hypothetical protein